jgi:hypothetical protein
MTYEIEVGPSMRRVIRNAIDEAIYDVLGGPIAAAERLGVSRQAVHTLLKVGFLRDRATALRLEQATTDAGCTIPAAELMDLAEWHGPQRHGAPPRGKRGPNGSSPRTPVAKLPVGGGTDAGREARAEARKVGRKAASRRPIPPPSEWSFPQRRRRFTPNRRAA